MKPSTALVLAGVTLALAGCNSPDPNRTTSVPNGVSDPMAITAPIVTSSASPAPAERGPIPANANAVAPGTNASVAFADETNTAVHLPPSKEGAPASRAEVAKAQMAVAAASDTAEGDAAKKAAMAGAQGNEPAKTARDSAANNPRGALTAQQESTGMPKAGQANNHSSPALEKDSSQPSK